MNFTNLSSIWNNEKQKQKEVLKEVEMSTPEAPFTTGKILPKLRVPDSPTLAKMVSDKVDTQSQETDAVPVANKETP